MTDAFFLTLIGLFAVFGALSFGHLARNLIRIRAARFEIVAAILLTIACLIPAIVAFTDAARIATGAGS